MDGQVPIAVVPAPSARGGSMVCVSLLVALVIIVIMVIIWSKQITFWLRSSLYTAAGMLDPAQPMPRYSTVVGIPDEDNIPVERLANPGKNQSLGTLPAGQTSDTLLALGYTGQVPWDEVMQASEIDPSSYVNHAAFVADTRNFSSGANFTEKDDSNNSFAFVNFIGLRRPQHVEIGASARQQQDLDVSVLKRNRPFLF